MATYNGWLIVTMPATPAPRSIEWTRQNTVALSVSPFSGSQQTLDWGGQWLEGKLTLPPLTATQAATWINFLLSCRGLANVFALPTFTATYVPSAASATGYWRLAANAAKWSVSDAQLYGLTLDIREAL